MCISNIISNILNAFPAKGCKITNNGRGRVRFDIKGKGNSISIGTGCRLHSTVFRIHGNNNTIIIKEGCSIGPSCSFWIEGCNSIIEVGKGCTFTTRIHFCAQEDNMSIRFGDDCMLSNNIIVRTSDSHPIYDSDGIRINRPLPIVVGKHVWIAPDTKIMKGSEIGDGCVIGSNTMTNKAIPANTLAVGTPAKTIKENIHWTREPLF